MYKYQKPTASQQSGSAALREALEKIASPIKYLQDEAKKEGANLDGGFAIQLANDANFLRDIAIKALSSNK